MPALLMWVVIFKVEAALCTEVFVTPTRLYNCTTKILNCEENDWYLIFDKYAAKLRVLTEVFLEISN